MTDIKNDIALYIHWPFCERKCPYCDFNSHVSDTVDQAHWRDALLSELAHFAAETQGRRLTSVFFGGGTPSLMAPATVAALLDAAADHWQAATDLEVTLEANPSSAEQGRFADYRHAGVNRLSIGVQSLRDEPLAFLGRVHDAAQARAAMKVAKAVFERVSFDLIYARPHQSVADWQVELGEVLAMSGDHLSVYQLTIEPGTAFFREGVAGADEDRAVELFEATQEILEAAGFLAYEISNHARPGAESRHNLTYWHGGDYVGIGPGAHGRITPGAHGRITPGAHGRLASPTTFEATHQIHDPARWLELVGEHGHGTAKRRQLSPTERAEEMIMTGLRLTEGLDTKALAALSGLSFDDLVEPGRLRELTAGGFLDAAAGRITATAEGRLRLNAILARLLAPEAGA
ncbi:MAG: radical SAM family heme chaperone HemW [Rhodospirillaceae bacterium]|nr:radical SAM family heme chaperone HemW [Rhodospirillaceae bacterium]